MWPRFSFTACSARGTKFALITGTFTALQYCRTDACSSACACWFMAAPPRATDRNHSVPASDVRSVAMNRSPEAVAHRVSVLAPSADAAPPPHPSSPAPTLAQSLFATLPNRVAAPDAATRSSRACLSAYRAVPVSFAITDQNFPANVRARATVSAVSSLPMPPAFLQHVQIMLQIQHRLMTREAALVMRHAALFVPHFHIRRQQPCLRFRSHPQRNRVAVRPHFHAALTIHHRKTRLRQL